jgi:methylmalonyl-CoA mutase
MATEHLLQEFPPVSTAEWEAVILKDLKGADYAKKLIWRTDEGLAVRPYYRAEDSVGLEYSSSLGARTTGDWRIREEIDATDPKEANSAAHTAVVAGAEEISFRNVVIANASDLAATLANLQDIPVHFENASEPIIRLLLERFASPQKPVHVSTGWSPLANLDFAAEVAKSAPAGFVSFTINGEEFGEAGATAVEEAGLALAAGIDFLAAMQARNVNVDKAAASLAFSFATGSNYFFEIAKLRAFRAIWARAITSFGGSRESATTRIYARTSRWNETIFDPHVNVLRGTTEAMSAVLGGADSVAVAPFDECYKSPDDASRRLARNTQVLLKQEALLSRVADAGAGSYCLEVITDFIAREGWKRMQAIEAAGGYQKAKADGIVAQILDKSRAAKEKAVTTRRRIFTGTNQHANLNEKALDRIEASHLSGLHRGTEAYEQLRLRTERHVAATGKNPRVLLAEIGDAKMRSARSGFTANFFGCAGFDLVTKKFASVDEILADSADVIVLCSSDPEYLALATELTSKLKSAGRETPVLVAGNPESIEQLQAVGVADFIHVRSNPIEVLSKWQQKLGIKD